MVNKSRYVAALSLVIIIFFLGVFLGNMISQSQLSDLKDNQIRLNTELASLELKDKLIEKNFTCNLSFSEISKEKVDMGNTIDSLEGRFGKNNKEVLLQKEIYELIEIRTLIFLKVIKENCNNSDPYLLFFYTNNVTNKEGKTASENQGYVLDGIYLSSSEKLNIFSFDLDIQNPATTYLIDTYGVKTPPSLVINDKLYEGFVSKDELKKLLNIS